MADINVEITNTDIAQWFGEMALLVKRQEKAIAVLSAKLDESERTELSELSELSEPKDEIIGR